MTARDRGLLAPGRGRRLGDRAGLLALALASARASALAETEGALPSGLLEAAGSIVLRLGDREVRPRLPDRWRERGEIVLEPVTDVELRLERERDGSGGRIRLLDARRERGGADSVRVSLAFPASAKWVPARWRAPAEGSPDSESSRDPSGPSSPPAPPAPPSPTSPPAPPPVPTPRQGSSEVLLSLHGGGFSSARGLLDPARGRGIDFSATWRGLRFSLARSSEGGVAGVEIEGPIPPGRQVAVLAWQLRSVPAARPAPGSGTSTIRPCPGRASFLDGPGWLIEERVSERRILRELERSREEGSIAPRYVELGDRWQAGARGLLRPAARDWFRASPKAFPRGLAPLVEDLASRGIATGLWIVPHGFRGPEPGGPPDEAFVRAAGGSPISGGRLGERVVDPTGPAGREHLRRLVAFARGAGACALRLAGLEEARRFYALHRSSFARYPGGPAAVFSRSLQVLREAAGEELALLGDRDAPPEAWGWLDAVRPRPTLEAGWRASRRDGLSSAASLRPGRSGARVESLALRDLEAEGGRADLPSRAVLAALTGRAILVAPELAREDGVASVLARARPIAHPRVLDVRPAGRLPPRWRLAVGAGSATGPYDVVGLFGWEPLRERRFRLGRRDLDPAVTGGGRVILWDAIAGAPLARGRLPLELSLPATGCRLLAVHRDEGRPQVVGASGPYLAQALYLSGVCWEEAAGRLRGEARIAGPLRLSIVSPPRFLARRATARGAEARLGGAHECRELDLLPTAGGPSAVEWSVEFELRPLVPTANAGGGRGELPAPPALDLLVAARYDDSARGARIEWRPAVAGRLPEGPFEVFRDGLRIGAASGRELFDAGTRPGGVHRYLVLDAPAWSAAGFPDRFDPGGIVGPSWPDVALLEVPPPCDVAISGWIPDARRGGGPPPGVDRSVSGRPLLVRGARQKRGIGVLAPEELDYHLPAGFARLECSVAVDDASGLLGQVVFEARLDGVSVWRSGPIRGDERSPRDFSIPLGEARVLTLLAAPVGGRGGGVPADWLDPRLRVAP